jgi:hypothetical protein
MRVEIRVGETSQGMSVDAEELLKLLSDKNDEIVDALENKAPKQHLNVYLVFGGGSGTYCNVTSIVRTGLDMKQLDVPKGSELRFFSNYPGEPYIKII